MKGVRKNMGIDYVRLGDMESALHAFSEEIRRFPEDGGSYYNRARVYRTLKQYREAEADLDVALKRSPHNANARAMRADLRLRYEDKEGTLSDFREARKTAPPNWKHRAYVEEMIQKLEKHSNEK